MNATLEWLNEEEGIITFLEENITWLTARFFVTGPEEAEFRLQDIVFPENWTENSKVREKVIQKVTKTIRETFCFLWEEGFEEVVLVEQKGSKLAEMLDSTTVVEKAYSEYMMCRHFVTKKSTGSGETTVKLTEEEEGFFCENREKTFFCRLLPYSAREPKERCFYLYEVEVDKKKRNKGIATACLMELFQTLAAEEAATVYLQVGSYNEPAVHLYEKLGFEISEELCYYAAKE